MQAVRKIFDDISLSWLENIQFFKPEKLKLFALITIKSLLDMYKNLIFGAWPFLIIFILLIGFNVLPGIKGLLLHLFLIASRPSTGIKNLYYFVKMFFSTVLFLILFSIPSSLLTNLGWFLAPLFLEAIIIYQDLFLLDAGGYPSSSLKAFWQGVKMYVYNAPFSLVISFAYWALITAAEFSTMFLNMQFSIYSHSVFFYMICMPLFCTILTNWYIKRLHEQFGVYYDIP